MKTSLVRIFFILGFLFAQFFSFASGLNNPLFPDHVPLDSNSISLISNIKSPTCASINDGQILVKPIGGQPDTNGHYTIKWLDFPIVLQDSISILSGLPAGDYCVEIIDSQGCSKSFCFDLKNIRTYNLTKTTENVSCHGDSTGLINVTVNLSNGFGTPPYQYNWESINNFQQNNQSNTTTVSQLKAGIYSLILTDDDGCTVTISEEISEPDPISPTLEMSTPIACNGGSGTFKVVNITGGLSTFFQYKIDDGIFKNSTSVSQLSAGDYDILIKESQTGCEWDSTFTVLEPPNLSFDSLDVLPQTCKDILDGGLRFRVSGGALYSGGYYDIDIQNLGFFQSDKIDTIGLKAGTYDVFVTDANGCIATESIQIDILKKLSLDTSIEEVVCYEGATGKILATVITDGVSNDEPFNFEWTGLPSGAILFNNNSTSSASNLPAGNYFLMATDADGCVISDTFEVTQYPQLVTDILIDQDASCPLVNDGYAVIDVLGGNWPYEVLWNTTPVQSGLTATQLFSGNYSITITDSNNCVTTQSLVIGAGLPPELELIAFENESCIAPASGSATVATFLGSPGYSYMWSTNPVQNDSIAIGLSAGLYEVIVTDKNGCTGLTEVEIFADVIPEITALDNDTLLCFGDSNGNVEAFVNTDAPPLNFEWSNNDTLSIVENLTAGIYYLTVTDNKECKVRDSVYVYQPSAMEATIPHPDLPKCTGNATALTVLEVEGGNGSPYFFSVNDNFNNELGEFISIQPDTYKVTIMDAEGCQVDTFITADERSELTLEILAEDVSFCEEISIEMFISDPSRIAKANSVQWEILDGGDGILSCSDCINPVLFPGDDIAYHLKVEVVDTNGCKVTEEIQFDRIQIPDLFTPNGDGANDFFEIRVCEDLQPFDNELTVFNQWGDVVFEREDYSNDWNGNFKGKELPEASYYFVFKIEVSERVIERKGRIAILR
ncbi:MAG: gliding motility-associated C-terminal domain-containing protein [Saprospiraceae bacterium]|jgi:gliding motility-associated-like protein|nr:gliding motility-associated C-terminal domain-containing protein [Saprospiraceae bacterium]